MITDVTTRDARYPIGSGHGSDAIHKDPVYSYAMTLLQDDRGQVGTGLAFTLGEGTELVCAAARFYAERLVGRDIEDVMAHFGAIQRAMADEQQFRWLGPHKGVVQLALASVTNACASPPLIRSGSRSQRTPTTSPGTAPPAALSSP